MKLKFGDLEVYFPFKNIYPEQYEYMRTLKTIFANSPMNPIIQIPPALSKATCLFSFYVSSYLRDPTTIPKLVFSAQSISTLEHAMMNLKLVVNYIEKVHNIPVPFLALSISEKKNLCINEAVASKNTSEAIDAECNKRIAPWNRRGKVKPQEDQSNGAMEIEDDPGLCRFYEGYLAQVNTLPKLTGCFSFEDLKNYGRENNICPYYLSEELYGSAQILLCDYFMLFGMRKAGTFNRQLLEGAFLAVDECCGLDEHVTEMYTERMSRIALDKSLKCVEDLNNQLKQMDAQKLQEDYKKLVKGLTKEDLNLNQINKKKQNEELFESMGDEEMGGVGEDKIKFPGYIRKPEHFITHLKKFILFLKGSITKTNTKIVSHSDYLERYLKDSMVDPNMLPLAFFPSRLKALLIQLETTEKDNEQFLSLQALVQFAQLFGSMNKGFEIILDNIKEGNLDIKEGHLMILSLTCLDPAEPLFKMTSNIGSILFHSETLVETDMFARIFDLEALEDDTIGHPNGGKMRVFPIKLVTKLKILPMIVSKGADQIELSTEHSKKHDAGVIRNYANMIVKLSEAVPDGVLCMFPNLRTLKDIGLDYYDEILEKKLIFTELQDVYETSKSVSGYKIACENGRGGVFMGIMRGKVLGHIPFDNQCARCILVFGCPIEYSRPREFLAKVKYYKTKKSLPENDFIMYSVMKEICMAFGKVLRKRDDATVVIFADKRFMQENKISRLPEWLQQSLENINKGLPSDQASYRASRFYKSSEYEKDWKKYSENDLDKLREMFKSKMHL